MLVGYTSRGSWPDAGPEYDDPKYECMTPVWDEIEDLWKDERKQELLARAHEVAMTKTLEALQSPPKSINQEAKNA